MALGTLILSTLKGAYGSEFAATITGQSAGTRLILLSSRDGFFIANGVLRSSRMPDGPVEIGITERQPDGVVNTTRFTLNGALGTGTGAPTAQATIATAAGPVYTYQRLLGSSSTIALVAGSNSNLTLNTTTGVISATAAIGVGASQTATVRESLAGVAVETPITITGVSATPTPTPTPGPTPSPSPTFSRMATTQAADSDSNSTLITALAANNARPTYTLAANTPRTIAWKIGAVADPGAFIAYIVDKSDYTAVAEQSFDSTNGADGAWTRLTDAIVFPAGGTSSVGAANTRQIASVASGAARWVRLTLTHTATANVYYPAVYQRPASGDSDVWLGTGPSLEGYGMYSKLMEDAIIAAYPSRDPVFLRYANGGTTVATVKNFPAEVAATHWASLFSYVMVGSAIGNDITDNYPISDDSTVTVNAIRANYDTLLNGFPGKQVFPCRHTYRAYTSRATITPTNQEDGSLGYNKAIIDPSVAADQAFAYDTSLSIPRVDLYSAAMFNRASLTPGDPVHFGGYNWYRAEWVRTAVRFAYTGTWPTSFIETRVIAAEATKSSSDILEAQAAINSLVASAAKAALQARLDAAVGSPSISFASPAPTVSENVGTITNTINVNRNGITGDLVVNLAYAGTAASGSDYTAGPATVTVLSANSSVSFDLTINDDTAEENAETIIINAALAAYPSSTATKTITIGASDAPAGQTYSPEATSYFAAMTVQPDSTRKGLIDTLIVGLKNDGVLAKLGRFNILAAHDAQAARVGVVDPAKSLTASNNPVFTVDRGYEGGGSLGYLSFGESYTASGKFTQDDLVVGAWCNLAGAGTSTEPHMGRAGTGGPTVRLSRNGTGVNETYNLNDATNSVARVSTGATGHRTATRVGTIKTPYYNGVKGNTATVASTSAPTDVPAAALRNDATYSNDRLAAVYFGASLTDAEVTSLHNRLSTYLTAIGAA